MSIVEMPPAPTVPAPGPNPQVQPTVRNRIASMDVLRGVAVLGILLANMAFFAGPMIAESFTPGSVEFTQPERWLMALEALLVNGKFRGMLAILFGVGLFLQFSKRSAVEGNWPKGYLIRMGWLAVFGLLHAIFLWYGDILFSYAITGFVAAFMVRLDDKTMKLAVLGCFLFALGAGGLLTLMAAMGGQGASMKGADDPISRWFLSFFSVQNEMAVYADGTYLQQVAHRAVLFLLNAFNLAFMLPAILGLFLTGILLGRSGLLTAPSKQPKLRNLCLGIGAAFLPLNAIGFLEPALNLSVPLGQLIDIALSMPVALGLVVLGAMVVESGKVKAQLVPFENVGRTAFSCYILQTVLCTAIFYSWGLGWFGRLDAFQQWGVAAGVLAVVVVAANVWRIWFELGPLEWAWRSLSERRRLPMRKTAYAAAKVA